jgi:hypothetical protein
MFFPPPSWLDVPFEARQSLLEFELRQYQTLTESTVIQIRHEGLSHEFLVTECRPAKGISIIDTNIETDIIEPAAPAAQAAAGPGNASVTTVVEMGREVAATAAAGQYCFFKLVPLPGKDLPSHFAVTVTAKTGDPDIFASQTERCPSQRCYTICAQEDEGSKLLNLDTRMLPDWSASQPCVFLGVCSLCSDTEFTLKVLPVAEQQQQQQQQQQTESAAAAAAAAAPDAGALSPGQVLCPNCQRPVPAAMMVRHERHCQNHMFRCQECNVIMPRSLQAKHALVAHTKLDCVCGLQLCQLELHQHQLSTCPFRITKCPNPWCSLKIRQVGRGMKKERGEKKKENEKKESGEMGGGNNGRWEAADSRASLLSLITPLSILFFCLSGSS